MSNFSRFMKVNKKTRENAFYAPTGSLCDENGEPLKFEFRPITSKENEQIREECTIDVPITGKPNLFRPKLNTSKYLSRLIVKSMVVPDLYNAELQDSYDVKTPEDLLFAMIDDAGDYQSLCAWLQNYQGFTKTLDEKVDEAKN